MNDATFFRQIFFFQNWPHIVEKKPTSWLTLFWTFTQYISNLLVVPSFMIDYSDYSTLKKIRKQFTCFATIKGTDLKINYILLFLLH